MKCFSITLNVVHILKDYLLISKKIFFLIALFIFLRNESFSQNYYFDWSIKSAFNPVTPSGSTSHNLTCDVYGNVWFVGQFQGSSASFGSFNLSNKGGEEIVLLKYDSLGNVIWATSIGGKGNDYVKSVVADSAGYVYITGYFESDTMRIGDVNLINHDTTGRTADIFIAKYDNTGNLIWAKSEGGLGLDEAYDITIDNLGNFYLTGVFRSTTISFGGTNLVNKGLGNGFVAKYDSSGMIIWARSFGNDGYVSPNKVVTDSSGSVYINFSFNGSIFVFGNDTLLKYGTDIGILKYDLNGNEDWVRHIGNAAGIFGSRIGYMSIDNLGYIYVTGTFQGTINILDSNLTSSGGDDFYLLKMDNQGNLIWKKRGGGSETELVRGLAIDKNNDIYVTGESRSNPLTFDSNDPVLYLKGVSASVGNMFVAKYNDNGKVLFAKNVYSSSSFVLFGPVGNFISTFSDAVYVSIVNGVNNSLVLGKDTLPSAPGNPLILTKLVPCESYTTGTVNVTSCDDYISPSGIYTWNASGTYLDTIMNAIGCDSIVTINLTIRHSSAHTLNDTVCYEYTSPSGKYKWIGSGVYSDTLTNSIGCDSIISIHLTVLGSSGDTLRISSCDPVVSPSGKYTWTELGTYKDTIVNSFGCDSIITVYLVPLVSSRGEINVTSCDEFTSPSGLYTWSRSGIYYDTLKNVQGCDSFLTVDLMIISIDTSITQSEQSLTANARGVTYQWMDCNSNDIIPNATSQSYTADKDGQYAVILTSGDCIDTSHCYAIKLPVDIPILNNEYDFTVFPNPSNGKVFMHTTVEGDKFIKVTDALGKELKTFNTRQLNFTIDLRSASSGLYFIYLQTDKGLFIRKVVLEN